MIVNMYAVYDDKTEAFVYPFFRKTDKEAQRYFGDACVDTNSMFNKHAQDYSLHLLAVMDDESGLVTPIVPVRFVARATQFLPEIPLPSMMPSTMIPSTAPVFNQAKELSNGK